ncbi:MAG TPA: substrate-binding domain-containing protein, partial [Blastocatellia bacterium]
MFALWLAAGITQLATAQSVDPAKALAEIQQKPLSKGPHGEDPASPSSVSLTPQEIEKVKGLKAKAAIVMHYSGNDWSQAQVAGLKAQFEKMGIEVVAVTDAGFKPEKQVADIETVLAQKPQIIVSIPTDPVSTAAAYQKASQQG